MASPILVAGVQRSGTSFLAKGISEARGVHRISASVGEPKLLLQSPPRLEEFMQQIPAVTHLLEKSASYADFYWIAQLIKLSLPRSKVLLILRDPLSRALSHYTFSRRNGLETHPLSDAFELDLSGVIRDCPNRVSTNPYAYLTRSRYDRYVPKWQATLGERLKIVTLGPLTQSKHAWFDVFEFLEIESSQINGFRIPSAVNSGEYSEESGLSALAEKYGEFLRPARTWAASEGLVF